MDGLDRKVIIGIAVTAAITASLYAFLSTSEKNNPESMDSDTIQECRDLLRESADILVQVARDDLSHDNPDDSQRLAVLEARVSDIENEMSALGCDENREQWVYGSFRQEMSEYESYIADLVRQNSAGQ